MPIAQLPCAASRPSLAVELQREWGAFEALSTDRPVGLTRGRIPWSSIHHYASRYSIFGEEFERFAFLIRSMDAAYLAAVEKE